VLIDLMLCFHFIVGMTSFFSDPHSRETRAPTLGLLRIRARLSRSRADRDTKSNRQKSETLPLDTDATRLKQHDELF